MNKRFTLALIVIGLILFIASADTVLAGGRLKGNFNATRCMVDYQTERYNYTSWFAVDRYRYTYQYSEWTVKSDNRLVDGFFIDWNTQGDLKDGGGGGVYEGQFWLVPEAASGVWVGEWSMVFKPDGNKVFTGEGVGRGGELEGLGITIYYEAEPGTAPLCATESYEDFSGKIVRGRK